MKSVQIKERLIQNEDLLIDVLEKYGFCHIKKIKQDEIRCGYSDDSNPTSVVINLENLFCTIWSRNVRGDIYTILQFNSEQTFSQVHNYLSSLFDGDEVEEIKPKKLLFNGFFKQFIGSEQKEQVYDEIILSEYKPIPNIRFIEDNISSRTQRKFNIMYDYKSQYIMIPWFNCEGKLVGVRGRNNDNESVAPRYMTFHSFKKGDYLYGYNVNREEILKKRSVIFVESEKATMQLYDMNIKNAVSVGSHALTPQQIRHLKFDVDEIIIAFDKDVTREELIKECQKIKEILPKVNIYIIWDYDNLLDEKDSPTDKGIKVFKQLYKTKRIYKEVNKDE